MTNNRDEARRQLESLADALTRDVDRITDEAVLEEAAQDYGKVENAVSEAREIIETTITAHAKGRFAAARQAYESYTRESRSNVLGLSADRKRALVEKFASNDSDLREKLTMAARNEKDLEADIDSFLEDLIELGVIDEDGNIR